MSYDHLLNQLESVLEKNITLYSSMESALREESVALTAHNLAQLESVLKAKSGVTAQIAALEQERLTVVASLAEATNTPLEKFNLTHLLTEVSEKDRTRFQSLQKRLRERVTRSEELNVFNRGVIEKLMKINHDSASNLQELTAPETSYGPAGISAPPLKSGRVVSRTL